MNHKEQVLKLCKEALIKVDLAIELHKKNEPADLSLSLLYTIKKELNLMSNVLDPEIFSPYFGRAISDWEDKFGLLEVLYEVSYKYKLIKNKKV